MLLYSCHPGKHAAYTQFDTIRSFRNVYGDFVRASPDANISTFFPLGGPSGKYQCLGTNPCGLLWFASFFEGLKNRMGQVWLPNNALSDELRQELMRKVEQHVADLDGDLEERHRWVVF